MTDVGGGKGRIEGSSCKRPEVTPAITARPSGLVKKGFREEQQVSKAVTPKIKRVG